jgi:RNA polymerase sigma-70 factor (ECF subfamily)
VGVYEKTHKKARECARDRGGELRTMNEDDKAEAMESRDWQELRRTLVAAVRSSMEEPLRQFYDAHFPSVYRYVLSRTGGDHARTDEIVGEVFYQAFRDIEKYNGRHAPHAWLRGIARHRTLDVLRRDATRAARTPTFSALQAERGDAFFDLAAAEIPEADLERRETAELVEWVLSALPPDYETLLRLRYLDDTPVRAIAEALSLSEKAAEAKLFRARNEFRDAFRRAAGGLVAEESEVVQ